MNHTTKRAKHLPTGARLKRAIIFARARVLPSDPVQESVQLAIQVQACWVMAEQLGAEIAGVYETRGGTTDVSVRAVVEELLRRVDRGDIDYVIVTGWDRLTRRPGELAQIVRHVQAAGASLVTTADPVSAFHEQVSLFCLMAKDNERRAA